MSLKAFHIVFVIVATLISAGFGLWAIQHYLATDSGSDLILATLAVMTTLGLPIYGVWFLKKMKHVGYV